MTKQCLQCSKTFILEPHDLEFYKKIQVPEPTLCPTCRFQRRLAWRNSRTLYKRPCDLCHQEVIGSYAPEKPYQVYCQACYYSDRWDPLDYARAYNPNQSFFEQFDALMHGVPHLGMNNQDCENSSYVNVCWKTTNSYLCFGSDLCDDCYYCTDTYHCRSTFNSYMSTDCELCSYCVDCTSCYNTHYAQDCHTVRDSYFCFDVQASNNCFGSAGLRNKEYYIFNKAVAKEQWPAKVRELFVKHSVDELSAMAEAVWNKVPRKAAIITRSERVTGNHIQNSIQARNCFDVNAASNVNYVTHSIPSTKDSLDVDNTGAEAELMYEFIIGYGYNLTCCTTCYNGVRDLAYCYEVQGSHDCFGSIGLRKQQYAVLNKLYSETEYKKLVQRVITQMRRAGEWGEFFPMILAPFAYNETEAQVRFPLSKAAAVKNGLIWKDEQPKSIDQQLPICTICGANYKVIEPEQKFLERQRLPQPNLCPNCRFQFLFQRRTPYQLWQRQCMCTQPNHSHDGRCTVNFDTSYSPERKEIIYCEVCYQKEIY